MIALICTVFLFPSLDRPQCGSAVISTLERLNITQNWIAIFCLSPEREKFVCEESVRRSARLGVHPPVTTTCFDSGGPFKFETHTWIILKLHTNWLQT